MKKWKKVLALVLCLTFVQAPVLSLTEPATVEAASVKKGLKKENGKYYYYVNGQKVKNTWKTISVKGQKKRFYFGSNGAAYAGKVEFGQEVLAFKKISGKWYCFDKNGYMQKGLRVVQNSTGGTKFCYFNSKGVYDAKVTTKYRSAAKYKKNAATLRKLLGKPKKTVTTDSCYGPGKDLLLYYTHYTISLYRNTQGKEIVLGIANR